MISYIENEQNKLSGIKIDGQTTEWIKGEFHLWGEVKTPCGVKCSVIRKMTAKGRIFERYSFVNTTEKAIEIKTGELGIWVPFNDSYDSAEVSERENCHAHLWCGGKSSYVCCLAMSGKAPHLGLAVTEGNVSSYLVERQENSNDRGDIMLLISGTVLLT